MSKQPLLMIPIAAFSSLIVCAQPSALSGPTPGFVFDAVSGSIRAVIGSLGSASLGPALGGKFDFASIAPRRNYAIAVRDQQLWFVSSLDSQPLTIPLSGASIPDGAAWSGDGSVAVLYSRSGNWIQSFTGFPGSIQAAQLTQIPLAGSLSAIAVDQSGQQIAIGVSGDQSGVYQMQTGQSIWPLSQMSAPASLCFSIDGNTLYALDQSTNQIFQINLVSSAVETWPAGVDDAVAVRAGVDAGGGNVIYIAGRNSRVLNSINPLTREVISSVSLPFMPAIIEPLGWAGFLLTRPATPDETLWSFINTTPPAIYFIPAATADTDHQEVPQQ